MHQTLPPSFRSVQGLLGLGALTCHGQTTIRSSQPEDIGPIQHKTALFIFPFLENLYRHSLLK
jgi:hypothetical protein